MNIQISEQIATQCPRLCVAALTAEVVNSDNCDALWQAIEQCEGRILDLHHSLGITLPRALHRRHFAYKLQRHFRNALHSPRVPGTALDRRFRQNHRCFQPTRLLILGQNLVPTLLGALSYHVLVLQMANSHRAIFVCPNMASGSIGDGCKHSARLPLPRAL